MTWEPYRLSYEDSTASPKATVRGPGVRFTVITPRLLRLEHSPTESFEDRPSQAFWHRRGPVPPFEAARVEDTIHIVTESLHLRYMTTREGFSADSLSIELRESGSVWKYGDSNPQNLMGTARTLDRAAGPILLESGLISRSGWAVVDDSDSLVFTPDGWLERRPAGWANRDLYFFGYGHDYCGCLRDFGRLAGPVPLIPRWALGNWWSRYWSYSQAELVELMEEFRQHEVPLSVCIIDMDWHYTQTGNSCSGWTGYTWNRDLFPHPEALLSWLHEQGLKVALNVHPAEGVHPHEEAYPHMAQAMGIDPASQQPVRFDIASPRFAKAYFELLHHPLESQGVDFWWVDWQQGNVSGLEGLDPLWWLNHLHFYDRGRDPAQRPFTFSRWGGLGNQRYPIGFSGDTHVTWEALDFQPYFTATAANVAYGWWSHDIGGHMQGVEEPELYTRWVQYGVFSPILRLHCAKNPYHERRPWGYDNEVLRITREAMQTRHALIPYLYSMAWRAHRETLPLVTPMYYSHPEHEEAYLCPSQYWFGSELVAAPVTSPADQHLRLSRQVVWLPKGDWFHFFSGQHHEGDGWHSIYSRLDEIPVFARAGAIVPLGPRVGWGGIDNPNELEVHLFPGADNRFELFEDDGESSRYQSGGYCLTTLSQRWRNDHLELGIAPAEGDRACCPAAREYRLVFHSLNQPDRVEVLVSGRRQSCRQAYDESTQSLLLDGLTLSPEDRLQVTLHRQSGLLMARRDRRTETIRKLLRAFRLETVTKAAIDADLANTTEDVGRLARYLACLYDSHARALVEVIAGAGADRVRQGPHRGAFLLWNNHEAPGIRYQFSGRQERGRFQLEAGPVPRFKVFRPDEYGKWRLSVDHGGIVVTEFAS